MADLLFIKPKESNNHQVVRYRHHANNFTVTADAHIHSGDPDAGTGGSGGGGRGFESQGYQDGSSSSSSGGVGLAGRNSEASGVSSARTSTGGGSMLSGGDAAALLSQSATTSGLKSTSTVYRVPLEDILEIVPLGGSSPGDDTNTKICSLNVYHILYAFNIVTLAKVYHILVRGKTVRDHWVKTLTQLCSRRAGALKVELYNARIAALSTLGGGSSWSSMSKKSSSSSTTTTATALRHSINEYSTREQLVAIPLGWFRYTRYSGSMYSENITLHRYNRGGGRGRIRQVLSGRQQQQQRQNQLGVYKTNSNSNSNSHGVNSDNSRQNDKASSSNSSSNTDSNAQATTKTCPSSSASSSSSSSNLPTAAAQSDLLLWSDSSMVDSNASSKRIILNARSCYTSVNYSRPLLMLQRQSPAAPASISSPRNLVEYIEAILQLLFDILDSTRTDATQELRRRQREREQEENRNMYVTPGSTGTGSSVDFSYTVSGSGSGCNSFVTNNNSSSVSNKDSGMGKQYNIYFNNTNKNDDKTISGTSTTTSASHKSPSTSLTLQQLVHEKPLSTVDKMWVIFLDAVASLQNIDLLANIAPNSLELVCIWVNLFHIMQMHSVLVLGPPRGTLAWISQFRSVSYAAFGDVFSLCEMEHNILGKSEDDEEEQKQKLVTW